MNVCGMFWRRRPKDNEQRWQRFELYECYIGTFLCRLVIHLCSLGALRVQCINDNVLWLQTQVLRHHDVIVI